MPASVYSLPHLTRTNSAKMFEWPSMRTLHAHSSSTNPETMISFPTPLILNSPPPKPNDKEQPKDYWLSEPSLTITIQPATPTPSPRDDTNYFPATEGMKEEKKVEKQESEQRLLGGEDNYWIYQKKPRCLFDLTRPELRSPLPKPLSNVQPRKPFVEVQTTSLPILIHPAKTVLLVVDMINGFMYPGNTEDKEGAEAQKSAVQILKDKGTAAARKAGIQVLWLGWGLEEGDLGKSAPQMERHLAFETRGEEERKFQIGEDVGMCEVQAIDESGACLEGKKKTVEQGRWLMRNTWNTEMFFPMKKAFEEGQKESIQFKDRRFWKTRVGGLGQGSDGELERYLRERGITTILTAGLDTEICLRSAMMEAALKGYDTLQLKDGCVRGEGGVSMTEESTRRECGFTSSCEWLEKGVSEMKK